jgi:hypothetical protein
VRRVVTKEGIVSVALFAMRLPHNIVMRLHYVVALHLRRVNATIRAAKEAKGQTRNQHLS